MFPTPKASRPRTLRVLARSLYGGRSTQWTAWERETAAEHRRCGLRPINEEHLSRPLTEHLADYRRHLQTKDDTPEYIELTIARLRAVFDGCGFRLLKDLETAPVREWLHAARTYAQPLELGTPLTTSCKHATAKSYREIAAHFQVTVSSVEKWKREGAPIGRVTRKKPKPNDLEAIRQWRLARETGKSEPQGSADVGASFVDQTDDGSLHA